LKELGYDTKPTLKMSVDKADCVILAVNHDEFRKSKVNDIILSMPRKPVIVDGTHTLDPTVVEKMGAIYRGIGTGTWTK
jgi:UDP-N-acetyl-D-mannosaminuronate dehydrogenase